MSLYDEMIEGGIDVHCHIDFEFSAKERKREPEFLWLPKAEAMGMRWPGGAPVAHWIEDGEEVGIAGIDVRAIHTPGHSPGSVTFVTSDGLIVGDVLFRDSVGRTDLPGGDWETLVRSIRERLFVFPGPTRVCPGHGPETTIGREAASNPFVGASALGQA